MRTVDGYLCDKQDQTIYSPLKGRPMSQRTILVPGGGCSYYRAMKGDACTFCAFPGLTREVNKGPGNENYFGSWKLEFRTYKKMYELLTQGDDNVDRFAIFNGGSFFPNSELPDEFQKYVYEHIAQHKNAKQIFVEAYPRFITQSKLENAVETLGNKELIVGIGFESRDDTVRNVMLKKGIDIKLFESKIRMMQAIGIRTSIYVFLKAPQLTEKQAFEEALNTLKYLYELGVDEMVLSCAFVPEGTKLETMYNLGEFRPPWLWTILAIIQEAKSRGWPLVVGGFDDTPPPITGPSNCEVCDPIVLDMIEHYRKTGSLSEIAIPHCECHKEWLNEMNNSSAILRIV